jgi:ectoine hydroxylase-related dioxygenase (phytanoyl-CoA dioxygenase family)
MDLEQHRERIERDGYTILEDAIEPDLLDELTADLERLERELAVQPAGNSFEGHHTLRVYNLLAHGLVWQRVPVHPDVLAVVEIVLDRGCLISSLSSIAIEPGEIAQPLHADDQLHPLPRPHPATVCNSMWALTDFTEANGATRVGPGSHRADSPPEYGRPHDSVPAEMARGSVLIWHGSLWHGGGANTTDHRRVGIAMNYCAGWIRQQENQQLGLPLDLVAGFEPRLQELCGFGIYKGLIGHIDKQSPARRLLRADPSAIVWDVV